MNKQKTSRRNSRLLLPKDGHHKFRSHVSNTLVNCITPTYTPEDMARAIANRLLAMPLDARLTRPVIKDLFLLDAILSDCNVELTPPCRARFTQFAQRYIHELQLPLFDLST